LLSGAQPYAHLPGEEDPEVVFDAPRSLRNGCPPRQILLVRHPTESRVFFDARGRIKITVTTLKNIFRLIILDEVVEPGNSICIPYSVQETAEDRRRVDVCTGDSVPHIVTTDQLKAEPPKRPYLFTAGSSWSKTLRLQVRSSASAHPPKSCMWQLRCGQMYTC